VCFTNVFPICLLSSYSRDIPRIPESSHPPLESSKCHVHFHHTHFFFHTFQIRNPCGVCWDSSPKSPESCFFISGLQFLWVPEDGTSFHLGDVSHQPGDPARPSAGAPGTAVCEYTTWTRSAGQTVRDVGCTVEPHVGCRMDVDKGVWEIQDAWVDSSPFHLYNLTVTVSEGFTGPSPPKSKETP